jgi:thioesterase domain-containing protein/acyl carrier protein
MIGVKEAGVAASVESTQDRDRFALPTLYAAPSTEDEKKLCTLWEQVLVINGLGIDDDFFLLEGDSLSAVTLFTEVERVFGIKPPLAALLEHPTIRKLAALIATMRAGEALRHTGFRPVAVAQPPLVAIRESGSRLPLHVVHGNGGNVLMLTGLLRYLAPDQPLYGVTARGLHRDEAPHTDFDALIEDYLAGIRRVQPTGPYYLAGYCIGGILACEMARRLRARGEDVRTVIMIDPDYNRLMTPWLYWRHADAPLTRLVRYLAGMAWRLRGALLRFTRQTPGEAKQTPEDRRRYWTMQDQFAKAFRRYRPQAYEGSVILLGSADRAARAQRFAAGWRVLAPNIRTVVVGPDHPALFRTHLPVLCAAITAALESRSIEDAVGAASPLA